MPNNQNHSIWNKLRSVFRELSRGLSLIWGGYILVLFVNLSTYGFTTKPADEKGTALGSLIQNPLLIISGISVLLLLSALIWSLGRGKLETDNTSEHDQGNRDKLIRKLHQLYKQALPDLTDIPVNFRMQHAEIEQVPAKHMTIFDLYNQPGSNLIMLGGPGVGKTTQIYSLAQILLERAETNQADPLPVVLNLSSWTMTGPSLSLEEWVIKELVSQYEIPQSVARNWLGPNKNKLLLLLDGLDEVKENAQISCIHAINTYINKDRNYLICIVISSRREEYEGHNTDLDVDNIIIIDTLSGQQITQYLRKKKLWNVLRAVENNIELQKILNTPLMLGIVAEIETSTIVPQTRPWQRIFEHLRRDETRFVSYSEIFNEYLSRKLPEDVKLRTASREQMINRLTWLAKQMQKRDQSQFYLERLQKDWLENNNLQPLERLQVLYQRFAGFGFGCILGTLLNLVINNIYGLSDFTYTIIYGLISGLIGGLLVQVNVYSTLRSRLLSGLLQGIVVAVAIATSYLLYIANGKMTWTDWWHNVIVYSPTFGLCIVLLTLLKESGWIVSAQQAARAKSLPWEFLRLNQVKLRHLSNGIIIGIVIALGIAFADARVDGFNNILEDAPSDFLVFVLTTTILSFGLAKLQVSDLIRPVEAQNLSWPKFWRNLTSFQHILSSIAVGIGISFVFFLTSGLNGGMVETVTNGSKTSFTYGIESILVYWLLFGFFLSLSSNVISNDPHIIPNQGIKFSGRNGLIFGIIVGCLCWLMTSLASLNLGIDTALNAARTYGLIVGLAGGLLYGLVIGGMAYIQHYLLRFFLARAKVVPFRYAKMLNEAVDHKLLRKVGGAYYFIHPLFRDYLAAYRGDQKN